MHKRALADAAQMRPHIDGLIARRKAALTAGDDVPDDILTRLLRDGACTTSRFATTSSG